MKFYFVIKFPDSDLYLSADKSRRVPFVGNALKKYESEESALDDLKGYKVPFIVEKIYSNE